VLQGFLCSARSRWLLFTPQCIATIFCNIEQIYDLSTQLLTDMEETSRHSGDYHCQLGPCFLKRVRRRTHLILSNDRMTLMGSTNQYCNKSVLSLLRRLSTWCCPHLLLSAGARSYRSISAADAGAQKLTFRPSLLLSIDGTDGLTDRQTDADRYIYLVPLTMGAALRARLNDVC